MTDQTETGVKIALIEANAKPDEKKPLEDLQLPAYQFLQKILGDMMSGNAQDAELVIPIGSAWVSFTINISKIRLPEKPENAPSPSLEEVKAAEAATIPAPTSMTITPQTGSDNELNLASHMGLETVRNEQ